MESCPKKREIRGTLWSSLYTWSSMNWKFLPFVHTDEEADLYPEGRCSIAFLRGDRLHRSRHTLALPPSFFWDSSLRSKWGTKLLALGAEPMALFYPVLTRQHEWYRNELNHWLKLWYTIEQCLPTCVTNRHIETITHYNDNLTITQRQQIRLSAGNQVAPTTPGRSWTYSRWRASILCHLQGGSAESTMVRAEWYQVGDGCAVRWVGFFFLLKYSWFTMLC